MSSNTAKCKISDDMVESIYATWYDSLMKRKSERLVQITNLSKLEEEIKAIVCDFAKDVDLECREIKKGVSCHFLGGNDLDEITKHVTCRDVDNDIIEALWLRGVVMYLPDVLDDKNGTCTKARIDETRRLAEEIMQLKENLDAKEIRLTILRLIQAVEESEKRREKFLNLASRKTKKFTLDQVSEIDKILKATLLCNFDQDIVTSNDKTEECDMKQVMMDRVNVLRYVFSISFKKAVSTCWEEMKAKHKVKKVLEIWKNRKLPEKH
jgi:Fe-S-cluster formation regulator IscX/YfhJ